MALGEINPQMVGEINATAYLFAQRLGSKLRAQDGHPSRLRVYVSEKDAMVQALKIRFGRWGVYKEKGAGRGAGGAKGSRWQSRGGEKTTNPNSFGKMNTGNRKAKPWFNPVIKVEHPKLAQDIANITASASIRDVKKWLIR